MAVTLTDFAPKKITNNASTAGHATQVTFAPGTVGVWVTSEVDDTRLSSTGTDNAALGDDYLNVPADTIEPRFFALPSAVFGNPPVLYVAHDDTSGVTRLWPVFGERPV